jgi:hypothetical protein
VTPPQNKGEFMTLLNNTPNPAFYGISSSNGGDCGTLDPNGTADWPSYDNQTNVSVSFRSNTKSPNNEYPPFSVTIPESGTGTTVTIGLYLE